MGIKILLLIGMIFCHIVDDYYLQGWLASAKQKSWWEKNSPDDLYKHDYLVALFMHSFSWTFMIMLPTVIYSLIMGLQFYLWLGLFAINLIVHGFVDNLKANKKKINLVQDQTIHMIQIFITWLLLVYMA